MSNDIILTVPSNFTYEFIGIVILDILHDAKGKGFLAGHKLYQITDLLTLSIEKHNADLSESQLSELKMWVFKEALKYLLELWESNKSALGLSENPDFGNKDLQYWNFMRDLVVLPLRLVADRSDEDTFVSVGTNKYGIEAQNYHDQKQKLQPTDAEILSFISPHGISGPSDYYRQAIGIVDIIKQRTNGVSKAVMDMKSSAGIIRTITDPLQYITGLPTFADPGYNMPGMSAIRKYSETPFLATDLAENQYRGPVEFNYTVLLETPVSLIPLTLLKTNYFYGVAESGVNKSNMIINILNETFNGTLPRSGVMAEALNNYLDPKDQVVSITTGETLETLKNLIINYYNLHAEQLKIDMDIDNIYTRIHSNEKMSMEMMEILKVNDDTAETVIEWIYTNSELTNIKIGYLMSTLRLINYYIPNFFTENKLKDLLPNEMVTEILPEIMYNYSKDLKELAFCYHSLKLLEEYAMHNDDLKETLAKQWLPKRKGKLTTQIYKNVDEWYKSQGMILGEYKTKIHDYVLGTLQKCHANLQEMYRLGNLDADENDNYQEELLKLLHTIPFLDIHAKLKTVLNDHLIFYNRNIHLGTANIIQTGLFLVALLDIVLNRKGLLNLNVNLTTPLTISINPKSQDYDNDIVKLSALHNVLGKFSGDFGQIMWCIANGHLFSSEDNNASAMALLLHRLPSNCIIKNNTKIWGNIHGLGDGGCVDVIIDIPFNSKKRKSYF